MFDCQTSKRVKRIKSLSTNKGKGRLKFEASDYHLKWCSVFFFCINHPQAVSTFKLKNEVLGCSFLIMN